MKTFAGARTAISGEPAAADPPADSHSVRAHAAASAHPHIAFGGIWRGRICRTSSERVCMRRTYQVALTAASAIEPGLA